MEDVANTVPAGLQAEGSSGSVDFNHCSMKSLKQLFGEQHRFMNYFFDNLEYEPLQRFCQECLECKGVVCFTGVGKSGFIAQKITQTLVSTGTKAVFLSPTDALHGDIGIIGPDDLLVMFSKSGGTEELLRLVPYARAKGAKLVSVTSVKGNKLDAACDMAITLPLERELCPFDLAPRHLHRDPDALRRHHRHLPDAVAQPHQGRVRQEPPCRANREAPHAQGDGRDDLGRQAPGRGAPT